MYNLLFWAGNKRIIGFFRAILFGFTISKKGGVFYCLHLLRIVVCGVGSLQSGIFVAGFAAGQHRLQIGNNTIGAGHVKGGGLVGVVVKCQRCAGAFLF